MKVDAAIWGVITSGSSKEDKDMKNLKVYTRIKAMFVDSSIEAND
eukprot:CAMPEP_0170560992 /NCGR_PEP_ID=MMETSP0211-20121228/52115_1 /TAXON_ID=311385 /ORGANISM="Pseudokeronopsis sp., Strain OXSARD2" /LENGTH=44 /DNA_ID= /DNA_START= /DNA_END= /DNA_ORIENTATION=